MTTAAILLPAPSGNQGSASILAIQGNVPRLGLDFNARAEEVFNYHLKQTTFALNQIDSTPDLIVWPENSVDVDPFQNPFVGQQISDIAKVHSVPIIVGAVLKTKNGPQNASIMWDSNGRVVTTYIKRTLTPFGEYIPLRSLAQIVSPLTKNVKDFIPGKEIITHSIDKINVVPIICYEVINDANIQSSAARSNILVVQTNNATFADSGQSAQQLNITRIRAVENNRWVVSVSTTGVSAIIDHSGGIQQITKQNSASFLSGDVELSSGNSLAYRFGNWTAFVCIFFSIAIYLGKRRRDA
jgi:apolipoprotein N-acyltransferase